MNLLHLQSGSDIRGNALESSYGEITLTESAVQRIAKAFVAWLCKTENLAQDNAVIAIGHDSRLSANDLSTAFTKAVCNDINKVYYCGLCPTPAMFMTIEKLNCHGAVVVTASHHPYYKNGLKFFTKNGGLNSADIKEILTKAGSLNNLLVAKTPLMEKIDFLNLYYTKSIKGKIISELNDPMPLKGFHIVVDAGNGAGGFFAEKVLAPLGCDVSGSQFLEPNGLFPNHIPNPEDDEAMASICSAVKNSHADLGLIFDTDVDRAACVDSAGNEINKNNLIALASCIIKEDSNGTIPTVVTDSTTSAGLEEFLQENLKIKHMRYKRGYKNVINKAIELNSQGIYTPLAIETSGHAALLENNMLDDGAYLMMKIIIYMVKLKRQNKTLFELISGMSTPVESFEMRLPIITENYAEVGSKIIAELEKNAISAGYIVSDDSHEGTRIIFNDPNLNGRALLRLSVHDPIMPLNLESNVIGGCKLIAKKLLNLIDKTYLDTSNILNFTL